MDEPIVKPVAGKSSVPVIFIVVAVAIVVVGIGLGALLPKSKLGGSAASQQVIKTDKEAGSTDTKTFRDMATGTIEKGGSTSGAGTHKLLREGGVSQTVYIVSSVIDLDEYDGKKVEAWGETQKVKGVSWFMDVGRVKLLE